MKIWSAIGLSVMIAGCATSKSPEAVALGKCQASAAKALVGQTSLPDAEIMRRTGSKTVRRIAPGDMVTMDFIEGRVTVTIDGGNIVSAKCG